MLPHSVASGLIPRRSRRSAVAALRRPPPTPRVPLFLRVRRTREGDGEGSSKGLRGRVGEVDQWARRHHRTIDVPSGLDGSQEDGVHRLDLEQTRKRPFGIT